MKMQFSPDNIKKTIQEANEGLHGINRHVKLEIILDGLVIPHFLSYHLNQYTQTHHAFELSLPYDALGQAEDYNLEQLDRFIGRRLTTIVSYRDEKRGGPQRVFVGTVTSINFQQENRSLGQIVLKGYSPTILMDGAPHTQSFGGEYTLDTNSIANICIEQCLGIQKYDYSVKGKQKFKLPFTVQYEETHYNFLSRLAAVYGDKFYYDGEFLHYGDLPEPNAPLVLVYGSNMHDVNVEIKAVHTKPDYYGYSSKNDTLLTTEETPVEHVGNLAKRAYAQNQMGDKFRNPAKRVAPMRATTDIDVVYAQRNEAGLQAIEVFTVTGTTSLPFLYPGCIVDLDMKRPNILKPNYFTRVIITDIEHSIDTKGHYEGKFKAVAEGTGYLPRSAYTFPNAQPQIAKVIDNADPESKGRVKVQFLWQSGQDTTDFIRVMTPDAGGTDQITQNRGYVAIPEIGDQVMVGFQHNHPDRPFVMGGMFHGGVALGGGANNSVKSIQTRSGHRIVFTEDESIIITDKSGNEIHLDTTGSNINITAPETMTFTAKNMNFNVAENMNTSVGMNQTSTIGMNKMESITFNYTESVGAVKNVGVLGNFMTNVTGKLTHYVKGDMETYGEKEHKLTTLQGVEVNSEGLVSQHSEKEVQNNSGEKSKNF